MQVARPRRYIHHKSCSCSFIPASSPIVFVFRHLHHTASSECFLLLTLRLRQSFLTAQHSTAVMRWLNGVPTTLHQPCSHCVYTEWIGCPDECSLSSFIVERIADASKRVWVSWVYETLMKKVKWFSFQRTSSSRVYCVVCRWVFVSRTWHSHKATMSHMTHCHGRVMKFHLTVPSSCMQSTLKAIIEEFQSFFNCCCFRMSHVFLKFP